MDVDSIGGHSSTLEAMAKAVEDADAVLLCMSEHYKDSANCRLGQCCLSHLQLPPLPLCHIFNDLPYCFATSSITSLTGRHLPVFIYSNCLLLCPEAEYAFDKGKVMIPLLMQKGYKPDGWLGILKGSKLYIDFSGKYSFEEQIQKLLAELGGRGRDPGLEVRPR